MLFETPAEAISDLGTVKEWAPESDQLNDDTIDRCLLAASQFIEDYTGLVIMAPSAAVVVYFDGSGRRIGGRLSDLLYLGQHIDAPASVAVEENGNALTVAEGYQTEKDVVVVNQHNGRYGVLHRRTSQGTQTPLSSVWPWSRGWAAGSQNIKVTYIPGWTTPAEDIVQAAVELTWITFKQRFRVGKTQRTSGRGTSITYLNDMSFMSKRTLEMYRRYAV